MARVAVNGISLNVETAGSGRPLVMLHGFTGSAASWLPRIDDFSAGYYTLAIDLLGHGLSDSPADETRYRMAHCLEDLIAILDQFRLDKVILLGYSMGGRVALHFAAAHPERLSALILEGAAPGLADPVERQARIAADRALADNLELSGLEWFVEYWTHLPLFASQDRLLPTDVRDELRAQRLRNNVCGLANSLRGIGAGAQEPLWDRLSAIHTPTLLITGQLDAKFTAIARQMAASMPNAHTAIVPDAGHAVHVERPEVFDQTVLDFLGHTVRVRA